MASVNKVIVLGNLGRDPEVRHTPSGVAVANLAIATTRKWKDKQSGDTNEETEWHRVVLYDRLAEVAGEYVKKGQPLYVEGRLKTRKWTDKDDIERYTTEIVAESIQLLGRRDDGRKGNDEDEAPRSRGRQQEQEPDRPRQRTQQSSSSKPQQRSKTSFDDMDDDIPF